MKNTLITISLGITLFTACGLADPYSSGTGGGSATRPFNTGGGTGSSTPSGGSSAGASCSAASTCQAFSCSCGDGTFINTARYCLNRSCQAQSATCTNACRNNLGVASSSPSSTSGGSSVPTATVYGCSLSRYSSDHSTTATFYGSSSTRTLALNDAQTECTAADWASWFCTGAVDSCVAEDAVPYSCTFAKYSSQYSSTIHFYGSGLGPTAAKGEAVDACLRSGQWQGWFCTSGILSCTRD